MPPEITSLANIGAVGAILAWFLWQTNPRLDRIEKAIDRQTRAILLTLVSRPEIQGAVREQARLLLKEAGLNAE